MVYVITVPTLMIAEPKSKESETWNQWRGQDRTSVISQDNWPRHLGAETLREQWSVPLNEGYSSPVLTQRMVYSLETRDKTDEVFRAFDRHSGEELWSYTVPGAMKVPFFAARNGSWARSTPATDQKRVYFLTMLDVLTCLDAETGNLVWQVDLKQREGTDIPTFGGVSSPLIDGDYLYIQGGHAAAKLDTRTSENLWRVLEDRRGMFGGSFSSPIIASLHGVRQFIVQTRSTLAGVDLESGEILWSRPVKASRGMNILTPLVSKNRIFTASYGGGSFCYEIGLENGAFSVDLAWQNKELEGYMTTPVTVGNCIYHQGRDKKLYCIDFETGDVQWTSDKAFGQYWSMVVNGIVAWIKTERSSSSKPTQRASKFLISGKSATILPGPISRIGKSDFHSGLKTHVCVYVVSQVKIICDSDVEPLADSNKTKTTQYLLLIA